LFDEQFTYVPAGSGFIQVGYYDDLHLQTLAINGLPVVKSGYLFVYLSNEVTGSETGINVFFDNLVVQHSTGPLTEENVYYPFGLQMAGISSKAIGRVENKKKYNGYEENKTFDLNLYETFYRMHDPQLGRFWQIDPKPNEFESLYAAMGNNPVLRNDPFGDTTVYVNSNGDEIYRTNEKKGKIVSAIKDDDLALFKFAVVFMDFLKVSKDGDTRANILHSIGENYDAKSVFAFADSKKSDTWDSKVPEDQGDRKVYWKPTDGKGPLIREWSAKVEKKANIWTATGDNDRGNPFSCTKGLGEVTVHLHLSEDRKAERRIVSPGGTVLESGVRLSTGKGLASTGSDASSHMKGTGLYDIAVGAKLYFYNITGGVFSVDRNLNVSKQ
jgi:RHS repeat-associated protein